MAVLNNKPAGGCANLFHRLFIPPSLNPSNSFFSPSVFLSIVPVWTARFYHGYSNTGRGCGRLPNTPNASNHTHTHTHTHTHRPVVTSQIPSEGSARLASSLLLPLHLRCSLLLRPLAARPRWNRTAAVQPPCNTSWVPLLPTW